MLPNRTAFTPQQGGGVGQICAGQGFDNQTSSSDMSLWQCWLTLAHQNRTIAIASDFRIDGARSPEIPQKEGVSGSEIAARNRKSLATFHRTPKSQCSIAISCLGNRCDFWGPRWASQSQIANVTAISVH